MQLRIDELARRAGTTSRNVRAYQARGLLPPPTLTGRTGYYGEDHLRRLELIADLQERGFSLEAIRHILDAWTQGGDLAQLVGLRNVLTGPLTDEQPRRFTAEQIEERFPGSVQQPALVARAVELGLLEVDADGTFVAPSPVVIEAGAELVRTGVALDEIFDLVATIRPHIAAIADAFVGIVSGHVTARVLDGAQPKDVEEIIESLRRLRPIALEVVRPFLAA